MTWPSWLDFSTSLGIIGFVIGVVGVWLTIYYARQANEYQARLRRLTWSDFQAGAKQLAERVVRDGGKPDLVLALGPRGATVGHLLLLEFGGEVPMVMATNYLHDECGQPFPAVPPGEWVVARTNRSMIIVPKMALLASAHRILLVDDWVMSGDMMASFRNALIAEGVDADKLTSVTIAATGGAIRNGKGPDHFIWTVDAENTYFPWGVAR